MLVTSRFEDPTKSFFVGEILVNGPFSTAAKQYNEKVLVTSKFEDPFCLRKSSTPPLARTLGRSEKETLIVDPTILQNLATMANLSFSIWRRLPLMTF